MRGDTSECSCSHGVYERSTHARRAKRGQESEKGARENPGGLQLPGPAKQGCVGMDLERPKERGRNSGWLYRLLSPFTAIMKGQNKICSRQPLAVQ